jgi:Transposase
MTTPEEDKTIVKVIKRNNRLTWGEIQQILYKDYEIDVSPNTVMRRAHEEGISGYIIIEKPLLCEEKVLKRLKFAHKMKLKLKRNPKLLEKMVFTDETKLRVFETSVGGNNHVRCKPDERIKPQNVNGKVAHGGGGLTFWGCINFNKVGELHKFEENLTGILYSEDILKGALKDSIHDMGMEIE